MHGVVLAAGEGTRLRPRTATRPKGLVEVGGTPILTRCLETLVDLGVGSLVVVVGYRADDIVSYYGDRFEGVPVTYAHQSERKGLAHALATAEPHVSDGTTDDEAGDGRDEETTDDDEAGDGRDDEADDAEISGDLVVMNGDNVCDANLSDVVARHAETGADATLLVDDVSPERASRTGVIEFDDDGRVAGLVEKPDDPPSTTTPRGFYAFSPRIFAACRAVEPSATGEYELTAAVDWLRSNGGRVETVALDGWCVNVNTEGDRERAERRLAGRS
jgi:glucose-1-phosphate thymidylyltransferase